MKNVTRAVAIVTLAAAGLAGCNGSKQPIAGDPPVATSQNQSQNQQPTPPPSSDDSSSSSSTDATTPTDSSSSDGTTTSDSTTSDSTGSLSTGKVSDEQFTQVVGDKVFPGQTLSSTRKQQLLTIGHGICTKLDAGKDMRTALVDILENDAKGLTRYQAGATAGGGIAAFCPQHMDKAKSFANQYGGSTN